MLGKIIGRTLLILGLVSFSLPAYADTGSYHLAVASGSNLWIDGNSTLHKYEIKTSTFDLNTGSYTQSSPTIPAINTLLAGISGNFVLTIPVNSLDDPEPGFNHNLWRALKYKQNPNIVFSMTSATATPDPSVGGRYDVSAQGTLTIAGKERPESISAVFDVNANTITISGSKDLLMTDYGVKPPTMFFGTIKTDDQVTIRWNVKLAAQ